MAGIPNIVRRMYLDRSLGIRVERAAVADNIGWATRFTIAGGPVLVTMLLGIRMIIQAGGAPTMQFRHSIGGVLCAATLITGDNVLTMYTITGDPVDNLQIGLNGLPIVGGISNGPALGGIVGWGLLMQVGNVQVTFTAGTGSTMYELCYIPMTTASNVVAV